MSQLLAPSAAPVVFLPRSARAQVFTVEPDGKPRFRPLARLFDPEVSDA